MNIIMVIRMTTRETVPFDTAYEWLTNASPEGAELPLLS